MKHMEVYGLGGGNRVGKSTFSESLRAEVEAAEDLEFSDPIIATANRWLETVPPIPPNAEEKELIDLANNWIEGLPAALSSITGQTARTNAFQIGGPKTDRYQNMHGKLVEYLAKFTDDTQPEYLTRENKYNYVEILQWLGYSTREFIDRDIWGNTMRGLLEEARGNSAELVTVGGVRFEQDAQFVRSVGGLVVRLYRPEVEDLHDYANEAAAYTWEADIDIVNDGTLEQLEQAALEVRNHQPDTSGVTIKTSEL